MPWVETELQFFGKLYRWSQPHEEKQFEYNECNFTFVKLSTFNTQMEKQHCLALHRNKITLFWSIVSLANHMKIETIQIQ